MSDRGNAQLYVYAVPPGDGEVNDPAASVLKAIDDAGLLREWNVPISSGDTLELGECYGDNEARLGIVEELGPELVRLGATFVLWSDPKWEWPGEITMHAPGVGTFTGTCDAEGNVYVTDEDLERFIAGHRIGSSLVTVSAYALRRLVGYDVRQAINAHRAALSEKEA